VCGDGSLGQPHPNAAAINSEVKCEKDGSSAQRKQDGAYI